MITKATLDILWFEITHKNFSMADDTPMPIRFLLFIFMILIIPFLVVLDIVLFPIEVLYYLFRNWIMKYIR